jgi:hypothetical protein
MFRTQAEPVNAREVAPPSDVRLPEERAPVDALVGNPVFFAPFALPLPSADRPAVGADRD